MISVGWRRGILKRIVSYFEQKTGVIGFPFSLQGRPGKRMTARKLLNGENLNDRKQIQVCMFQRIN